MNSKDTNAHNTLAANDPSFAPIWLTADTFLMNLVGANVDGLFVGDLVDGEDFAIDSTGEDVMGETIDAIGAGWIVVRVDWR